MRRNGASLKKLEALLKDNIKQREELVNLYGKTIETQERLEEMMSMLKLDRRASVGVGGLDYVYAYDGAGKRSVWMVKSG